MTAPSTTVLRRRDVAALSLDDVLTALNTSVEGLSTDDAAARLSALGPNSVRSHGINAWAVLIRQFDNAVLVLLAATAVLAYFIGDSTQANIVGIILVISVGLGFINEYRAERATAALHSAITHEAVARRDGQFRRVDVTALVPGDVVHLEMGELVPADIRLIDANGLECN